MSVSGLLTDGIGSFGSIAQIVLDGLLPNPPAPGTIPIYCKINGEWKQATKVFMKIDSTWKEHVSISCKITDTWKNV